MFHVIMKETMGMGGVPVELPYELVYGSHATKYDAIEYHEGPPSLFSEDEFLGWLPDVYGEEGVPAYELYCKDYEKHTKTVLKRMKQGEEVDFKEIEFSSPAEVFDTQVVFAFDFADRESVFPGNYDYEFFEWFVEYSEWHTPELGDEDWEEKKILEVVFSLSEDKFSHLLDQFVSDLNSQRELSIGI